MSAPIFRPLSFGEVLDGTFTLYRRHFAPLFTTALIASTPISVMSFLVSRNAAASGGTAAAPGLTLLFFAVMVVAGIVLWATLTRLFSQAYAGGEVSAHDAYRQAARSFFPLLGAGAVAVVGLAAAFVGIGIVMGIVVAMAAGSGSVAAIGVLTAVMMVVVFLVMLVAFAFLFAVAPAVVVERRGPVRAVRRSLALAKGAVGRVLGVTAVTWLIVFLPVAAVSAVTGTSAAIWNPAAAATFSYTQVLLQQLFGLIVSGFTGPFFVGAMVLQYYDRRIRTEAHDLEGVVAGMAAPAAV
jgi:hypothetical protein